MRWKLTRTQALALGCGATSVLTAVACAVLYGLQGYSPLIGSLWLLALIMGGACFYIARPVRIALPSLWDLALAAALLAFIAPLYLLFLYDLPVQVNTDEIAFLQAAESLISSAVDPFGLSHYFNFPSLAFLVIGWLAALSGDITLTSARVVNALFGLVIILGSYALFRVLYSSRFFAAVAAVLLGANHTLLATSRMAMRNNSGLLLEVFALICLALGLKVRSLFLSFIGGLIAGLAWYAYYPGRITIICWTFFMGAVFLFMRTERREVAALFLATIFGFVLAAFPIFISNAKTPDSPFEREQLLIYPEGRAHQQWWVGASSITEGYGVNIQQALTTFNRPLTDLSYIYLNHGFGFVDPLTGALLWIGIFIVITRRDKRWHEWLMLSSFFLQLFLFAFVVNKAPNYPRLLVILPFVAYFAAVAIVTIPNNLRNWAAHKYVRGGVIGMLVSLVVILNLYAYSTYLDRGRTEGDAVGSTARFLDDHYTGSETIYLISDLPYFDWGGEGQHRSWIGMFADRERVKELSLAEMSNEIVMRPAIVLMRWELVPQFSELGTVYHVTPDGRLMAVYIQ